MAHEVVRVHHGDTVDYTPEAAVTAGEVIVRNDLLGIAPVDIAAGDKGALQVVGVFDFPKATGAGTSMQAGQTAYWDATNEQATLAAAAGANAQIGQVEIHAEAVDDLVRIRLHQGFQPNVDSFTEESEST